MPKIAPELGALQVKRLAHGTVKKAKNGINVGDPICIAGHQRDQIKLLHVHGY